MNNILPYPNITATEPKEQIQQLKSYIFQLTETLEFLLTNINTDNLSPSLVNQLNDLGMSIENTRADVDERQQITTNLVKENSLTVNDVITSVAFQNEVQEMNAYADTKLTEAKEYSDTKLTEAKGYSDTKLTEAKAYTDQRYEEMKAYVDEKISTTE